MKVNMFIARNARTWNKRYERNILCVACRDRTHFTLNDRIDTRVDYTSLLPIWDPATNPGSLWDPNTIYAPDEESRWDPNATIATDAECRD
jgi:hypothetical protein